MRRKLREIIKDLLKDTLPPNYIDLLPSSYQRIGDIIIVALDEKLVPYESIIGDAILKKFGNVRTVCRKLKGISSELRLPSVKVIAGDKNTITIHRENNCLYKLDVAKVMFAKGNAKERRRVAQLVREGEVVVDMFAGIGYFTIPIAVLAKPSKIYAIDLNPVSIDFLKENIKLNGVEKKVIPILGDCREVVQKLGSIADRVIMGYIPNTYKFIPYALKVVKRTGGIIHYHDIAKQEDLFEKPINTLKEAILKHNFNIKILYRGIVKSYAPKVYHIVIDVFVKPALA